MELLFYEKKLRQLNDLHEITRNDGRKRNTRRTGKKKKDAFTTQTHAGVILANLVSIDG
jgi:hypothetical protein